MQTKLAGFWISPVLGILSLNIFFAGAGNASTFPFRAIIGVEALELSNVTCSHGDQCLCWSSSGSGAGMAL